MIDPRAIKIADYFGPATQLAKQSEESCELTEATDEFHQALIIEDDPEEIERKRVHMIEEMADTWITIQENIYRHSSPEEFKAMVDSKLNRTLDRMDTGYYAETSHS